jgi:hypothetical protein
MKPSERFRREAETLSGFLDAFARLMNATRFHRDDWSLDVRLEPMTSEQEWNQLRRATAAASGPAGSAYQNHGALLTLRNAAYITHSVNPVANWEMALREPENLPADWIVNAVEQALGNAGDATDTALDREQGFNGVIASFLRWPADLREAVGPGHRAQSVAAGAIGYIGQTLVAAAGGAMAVGIVALVVLLAKAAF